MRYASLLVGAALLVATPLMAKEGETPSSYVMDGKPIKLARYPKVFIGPGNVKVEVAPYKKGYTSEGAILVFHGVEGDWDGKAVNHDRTEGPRDGYRYSAAYEDRRWNSLSMDKDTGKERYTLRMPGSNEEIALAPSDGAAQLTSTQAIYEEYLKQQKESKNESEDKK